MYQSSKRYGHEIGLSCAFRQWRASSHCSYLHGYALAFDFVFESVVLDESFWIVDFGGLKELKDELQDHFDHKTVIAEDDPHLEYFMQGNTSKILDLVILPAVGCEMFARIAFDLADNWLDRTKYKPRVTLVSVKVSEHGANSATYVNPELDISRKADKDGFDWAALQRLRKESNG